MTDYVIQTEFEGPGFVAVPNYVAQDVNLTPEALGVLVWLASQPMGFVCRVAGVRERFGMGKDKWQRIARELRAAGAMRNVRMRSGNSGRMSGSHYIVRWPDPKGGGIDLAHEEMGRPSISRKTRPMDHKPGFPSDGKPAKGCRKTRQRVPGNPAPYKEKEKHQEPAALSEKSEGGQNGKTDAQAAMPGLWDLSDLQKSMLRAGNELVTRDGRTVKPIEPAYIALQQALFTTEGAAL